MLIRNKKEDLCIFFSFYILDLFQYIEIDTLTIPLIFGCESNPDKS